MSKKFEEIKQLNYPKAEVETMNWWKDNEIFNKSLETREDGIPFTFFEGPPTANGKPGIHHVLARTVKDSADIRLSKVSEWREKPVGILMVCRLKSKLKRS